MKKILPLFLALSLLLTGCGSGIYSNYKDVEQLQLIRTLGIDIPEEGGVLLSVSSGADTGGKAPTLLSLREASVVTAMERLQEYAARETLYFAHTRFLLLGQSAAEKGVGEFLDYVQRSPALRSDVKLFLLQNAEAKTLITGSGDGEYDVSDELDALLRDLEKQNGAPVFSCAEVSRSLAENGAALVHAIAPAGAEGVIFSGGGGLSVLSRGYGLLRGDALAGWITGDAAIGAEMLLGTLAGGAVTAEIPRAGTVTLSLRKGKTDLTPRWDASGNMVSLSVGAEISAIVSEAEHPENAYGAEFEATVRNALEAKAEAWLREVLEFSSAQKADCFGLGQTLRRQDTKRFDAMPAAWESLFPKLKYDISVAARLEGQSESIAPTGLRSREAAK